MQIIKSESIGFCNGVKHTVSQTIKTLSQSQEQIYCLGEIVHNEYVIKSLKDKGLIFIEDIKEAPLNSTVIIRAHGEPITTYEIANKNKIKIIDLTCGKVSTIHRKINNNNDKFIIIIGKPNHPEVKAHLSYAKKGIIISNSKDVSEISSLSKEDKIYIVAQTTFNENEFNNIVDTIKKEFPNNNIIIENTICYATHNRQEEIKKISENATKMIIIGSKTSSNTIELLNIAQNNCQNTYLINSKNELSNITFNKKDIVGIASGASTSDETISEIIELLESDM